MYRTASNFISLTIATTLLYACAGGEPALRKPREAWRGRSEAACIKSGAVQESAYVKRIRALNGPGPCGTRKPFVVSAALGGRVALNPPATLTCKMIPELDRWLAEDVQSAAGAFLGEPVTGVEVAASYGCRTRNSKHGAKISEHAFANAIDIRAFVLSSGRRVTVENGWRGAPQDALFLRSVHRGGCDRFKTIIGPDGDRNHRDHLHFDLAWHGKDGTYVYCE